MAGESLQKDDIMLSPLGLKPSFGFGDRMGLATPGHIAAVSGTRFSPVFAQQSVRENMRTGRTLIQVLDDAKRAVEAAGWDSPWGADADHLKTVEDLPGFVDAGYTFFTVDPGEHVDNAADTDPLAVLEQKNQGMDWSELEEIYISKAEDHGFGFFEPVHEIPEAHGRFRRITHAGQVQLRIQADALPETGVSFIDGRGWDYLFDQL